MRTVMDSATATIPTALLSERNDAVAKRLPLYLLGGKRRHVDLDGPALLLRQTGAADVRYPLGRLSRILAGQKIQWSPKALSACMEARIPIIFLGKGQEPIGYLLPVQSHSSPLDETIQETISLDRWETVYQHWLCAERMRILRGWRAARAFHGHEISEAEYRELVHVHVYGEEGHIIAASHLYYGAITALVTERLVKAGLSARYRGFGGRTLELSQDIASLLELALRLEIHGMGEAVHGSDAALLRILQVFGEMLQDRCLGILGRLHRTLLERLEPWR
ncbi:MAG: CRISPR-associated endonuclease Cas1 [Acidithiobacillus caldus]|nr:CRISPR-associated endonuclease Cas1 [Acidithiobacillus caldus]